MKKIKNVKNSIDKQMFVMYNKDIKRTNVHKRCCI